MTPSRQMHPAAVVMATVTVCAVIARIAVGVWALFIRDDRQTTLYVIEVSGPNRGSVVVETPGGTDQEVIPLPRYRGVAGAPGDRIRLTATNTDPASGPIACRFKTKGVVIAERSSFGTGASCEVVISAGDNGEEHLSDVEPAPCTFDATERGLRDAIDPSVFQVQCLDGWAFTAFTTSGQGGVALLVDDGGQWQQVWIGDGMCTKNSGLPDELRSKVLPPGHQGDGACV